MKTKLFPLLFFALGAGNIFAQSDYSSSAPTIPINISCVYQQGTLLNATESIPPITCNSQTSPAALDVWYKFVATSSTHVITVLPSINVNVVIDLRDGAPGNNIACADASSNGGSGGKETLTATGLAICSTYYIRIYNNGLSTTSNTFNICVTGTGSCSGCVLTGITPTINSPGSGSAPGQIITTTTPTLSWNGVAGAAMYGVYVRDMISNILVVNNDCATSSANYTISSGILTNGGQYRWNIIAYASCNSPCSTNVATPLYFQIQSCALASITPTIISPGTSSAPGPQIATLTPTLSWNAVAGAGNYGVYVRDMIANTLVVDDDCAGSSTNYTISSGVLNNNGQYRWNMVATDVCNGNCISNYSSQLYFQTLVTDLPSNHLECHFAIYPNPSSGILSIESNLPSFKLTITDDVGKEILSQNNQTLSTVIDLSTQPNGIYFLSFKTEQGTANKKIIIQK